MLTRIREENVDDVVRLYKHAGAPVALTRGGVVLILNVPAVLQKQALVFACERDAISISKPGDEPYPPGSSLMSLPSLHARPQHISFNTTRVPYVGCLAPSLQEKVPKTLIHPVTFNIKPTEMVAIMGASGAGKSTMLDILAQRVPFSQASQPKPTA